MKRSQRTVWDVTGFVQLVILLWSNTCLADVKRKDYTPRYKILIGLWCQLNQQYWPKFSGGSVKIYSNTDFFITISVTFTVQRKKERNSKLEVMKMVYRRATIWKRTVTNNAWTKMFNHCLLFISFDCNFFSKLSAATAREMASRQ